MVEKYIILCYNSNIKTSGEFIMIRAKNYIKTAFIRSILVICILFILPAKNSYASETNLVLVDSVLASNITYYVNENLGSDTDNNGQAVDASFATIQRAITEIENNSGTGTIIIMSDIELKSSIVINGSVTIKSDDNQHTITRSSDFTSYNGASYNKCMISINGELNLGNTNNADSTPLLIFDGGSESNIKATAELLRIQINGTLNLYSGVSFQNNNSIGPVGGISNYGNFYMYGGSVSNNSGVVTGGVSSDNSDALFYMYGGDITYNSGYIGGVNTWSSFSLNGGNIANNTGNITGGVYINQEGTFIMTGGYIVYNHGNISGGVLNTNNMIMSGGTIDSNDSQTGTAKGILNEKNSNFTISGSSKVVNNEVYHAGNPIIIDGQLTSENIVLTVVPAQMVDYLDYEALYNVGNDLVIQKDKWIIDSNNLNKITLSDSSYAINSNGKICKALQSCQISFTDPAKLYYYIGLNWPEFTIMDGTTKLSFANYSVRYYDFTYPGTARAVITGQGDYVGVIIIPYTINKAVVEKINTPAPENTTFYAADEMTIERMKKYLLSHVYQVDVEFNKHIGNLFVEWNLTEGNYNPKGGVYTFTGTLIDDQYINGNNKTLTTQITVLPSTINKPVFSETTIWESTNKAADKTYLGNSVLPTTSSIIWGSSSINSSILWDNQVIDTTVLNQSVKFTGTISYINPPAWLTLPTDLTVSRIVTVREKIPVSIGLSNGGLKDKYYDGMAMICPPITAINSGYTGEFELLYTSTDGKGYSSPIGPTLPGKYKLSIAVPSSNKTYKGKIEGRFEIFKKEVVLIADDITVQFGNNIPTYTYHFKDGYKPLINDYLLVEPSLTVDFSVTSPDSKYVINISGAKINDNYNITYVNGILLIKKTTSGSDGGFGGGGFGGGFGGGGSGGAANDAAQGSSDKEELDDEIINLSGFENGVRIAVSEKKEKDSYLEISYELPVEEILAKANQIASDNQGLNLAIPLSTETVLTQLNKTAEKQIDFAVIIPESIRSNKKVSVDPIIDGELLEKVKELGKDITIKSIDENGNEQYSWTFLGNDLKNSSNSITDVNMSLKVQSLEESTYVEELLKKDTNNNKAEGLVINFSHEGTLPTQANVKIFVGNKDEVSPGSKIYFYHYNHTSNKLDVLPYSTEYYVDKNGFISVNILHCSDYIVLKQEAGRDIITNLEDQINITPSKKTLYFNGDTGQSTKIVIKLPATLELVKSLKTKSSSTAIGTVAVSYKSSNKKVATVNSSGLITAKGKGTTTITVKFMLYNGVTKVINVKVTIKNSSVKITKSINSLSIGDSFIFKASVYGYVNQSLSWSSSDTNILKIDSKTGKAIAKSTGVAYIEAKAGNSVGKVKVIIK